MTDSVPTFKDLSFYSNPESNNSRYVKLIQKFQDNFGIKPEFISRSPGRVNLIGDHIDYNHFSVLPMAIDVDVIAAVGTSDDHKVVLTNTDESFAKEEFDLASDGSVIEIDKTNHTWGNYFKCGLIVAHKYIKDNFPESVDGGSRPLKGLRLTFNGTVPTGGGLSSSAAFCVASTLAILRANGVTSISKADLTRITVVSEHYVGVNTGGMDQCASIYGEQNKALLIQFKPKLIGIPFEIPVIKPNDMVFLISNSLLKANKHETAPTDYNLRVVEIAAASELFAKKFNLNLPKDSNVSTGTLRGFMDKYFEEYLKKDAWDGSDIDVGISRLEEMLKLTETVFNDDEKVGFETPEIAKQLGLSVEEFTKIFLTKAPVRYQKLKIYQRSKHVFSDSLRVLQVLKLLRNYNPSEDSEVFLKNFGKLLNDSHHSSDIYNDSSKPELDQLCEISTANGAYGARVTGAGFGGSVVHLTTADRLSNVVTALTEQYYKNHFPGITQQELDEAIVVSKPATGSCIVELDSFSL
ncbi:unnamed protein product [Debaryomyces tyrocola]|nr:unnamed protein product [Debaryomyces tyrocola]